MPKFDENGLPVFHPAELPVDYRPARMQDGNQLLRAEEPEYVITEEMILRYRLDSCIDPHSLDLKETVGKQFRARPHNNMAPQENQILVTFKDKATVDYILLVSRRKGYDLGDYIEGNFEWDDMLPCIDKINPEDCQFCDFRKQCPDRVGGA